MYASSGKKGIFCTGQSKKKEKEQKIKFENYKKTLSLQKIKQADNYYQNNRMKPNVPPPGVRQLGAAIQGGSRSNSARSNPSRSNSASRLQ